MHAEGAADLLDAIVGFLPKGEVFAPYYRYAESLVIGSYASGSRRGRGAHSGVSAAPSFERSPAFTDCATEGAYWMWS